MSDNDNKYKYINKKQIDETSMPSIHKIRSLYESKINADQNSYPVYKKRPVTASNSIKRSTFISKDESNNNLIRKDEKQSEKSNLNLDDFEDKNDKSEIIRGDNVYNYDMDTEEENYINNKSLKRKHSEEEYFEENEIQNDSNTEEEDYKDNVLLSYINDNDNSEEEEISDKGEQLNEKKTRLNYYSDEQNEDIVEKPVNDRNEYESSDSENLKEQNYEYDDIKKRKRQKTFDNSDNEVDNEEKYQYLNQEEDINNDNNNENVESGSPIKISEEPESVSKTDSNKLSGKTTSTPSKFRPFLFSNHFNSNDISVSGKHTLSKSSSSSSASSDSLNSNDSNNSKGLFGFKFSRKNSKVEDSDKKEESKLPRKNSASSKFSSFFHRTSSKTEKDQNTEAVSNNKNQTQKTNTIGTSTNNDAIDQDGVKRVPKRKRDSSDGENESDVE